MPDTISYDQLLEKLHECVKKYGTERKAATALGISQAYLNDIRRGIRRSGPKVLRALGYTVETTYKKVGR